MPSHKGREHAERRHGRQHATVGGRERKGGGCGKIARHENDTFRPVRLARVRRDVLEQYDCSVDVSTLLLGYIRVCLTLGGTHMMAMMKSLAPQCDWVQLPDCFQCKSSSVQSAGALFVSLARILVYIQLALTSITGGTCTVMR